MEPAPRRPNGFALIVVLWFLVLLSAIGAYMMANARAQTALAHNLLAGAHSEALADAAVSQAAFNLSDPDPRNHWPLNGAERLLRLPGGEATVRLIDESLKINPNLASASLMAGLFQAVGIDDDKAADLGRAIAYWVRPVENQQGGGDPASDPYEQAGRAYRAPHAPVETLDELQLVLGMTPKILAATLPYLTIFTDADAPPDPRAASKVVQMAVALAASDPASRQSAGSAPGGPVQQNPPANPQGGAAAGQPGAAQTIVATVEATGFGTDGGIFVRHAVIKIDDSKPKGYAVLDWRRGEPIAAAPGS
jgi:general secretion pathway protein K